MRKYDRNINFLLLQKIFYFLNFIKYILKLFTLILFYLVKIALYLFINLFFWIIQDLKQKGLLRIIHRRNIKLSHLFDDCVTNKLVVDTITFKFFIFMKLLYGVVIVMIDENSTYHLSSMHFMDLERVMKILQNSDYIFLFFVCDCLEHNIGVSL